jgi:hypothetical protein
MTYINVFLTLTVRVQYISFLFQHVLFTLFHCCYFNMILNELHDATDGSFSVPQPRVARWYIFKPKMHWVTF